VFVIECEHRCCGELEGSVEGDVVVDVLPRSLAIRPLCVLGLLAVSPPHLMELIGRKRLSMSELEP